MTLFLCVRRVSMTAAWLHLLGVAILTLGIALDDVTALEDGELREYCEDDTFQGRCTQDQVIVMNTATYGRMRYGTCIATNYGHQGCSASVLRSFDRWCSGKPTCSIEIRDLLGKVPNPCPKDLRNYLEASYACVNVVWPTLQRCTSTAPLLVTKTTGYLSSYVSEQTKCGLYDTPWHLRAPPGQYLRLTLHDFYPPSQVSGGDENMCQVLAVIKEHVQGSEAISKTVCAGGNRVRQVFVSQGTDVEIRFVIKVRGTSQGNNPDESNRYSLIHFAAVGCPDLEKPNMWFRRNDVTSGKVTAKVGCEGKQDELEVTCRGTQWTGVVPDCSTAVTSDVMTDPGQSVPYGVSVAIILAIALLIGAVILTIGMVVIRRRRMRAPAVLTSNIDPRKVDAKDDCYLERIPYTDTIQPHGYVLDHSSPYVPSNGENTYYRTWELQRHGGNTIPPMSHACAAAVVPSGYPGVRMREDSPPRYLEHIYESPKSVRKDVEALAAAADNLKYYELDPSGSEAKLSGKDNLDPVP